ncbi:helix-turn-helix domain-containing protein [Geomonas subterranea]|uniref:helix-turn-helix domain-containing protein n=1 Tax=Geomonas subterranea TaxID=2847989 RepID=UPI001CD66143|nr:helix-turn-helix transcriptional regulator [Geomonas fuzhouensis]
MKERRGEDIKETAVTPSSGNVFTDLGLPDAEELQVKSAMAMKINLVIEKNNLSQIEAAALLGISQSKVSKIERGRLRDISLEKLCNVLTLLGHDVDIVIRERKQGGVGRMRVVDV